MNELYKFPSNFVSDQFVSYIDREEIESITMALAKTINERYQGEELIIIGVLKGSMVFLADLLKHLKNIKVYVDFVHISSVGRSKENQGTIIINKDIKTNIIEKNVLIVEEIIDTGRALHFLKNRLSQAGPRSVEVLTLFDKPYKRVVPIKPDYIGKQIEDQFVVGYGLDLEEYGRNICDLFYLKYPN
ncbi:MAG: hypoxanthine phosphoribosyltransferase [Bacteriovoracaceae bacterium]|jgi:hypoxanthine phosphoribosyltransferase